MFKPKILTVFQNYSKEQFVQDFFAGIIVTILAVSLSIAFAVSMGVSPEVGLIVSVISSFVIALLGGTYVNVGGPSAVYIVAVASIVATHGFEGMIIATFMAGIILVLLGIFRLGGMIKYLPYPIIIGFMAGAAVMIFTTQIREFLGLNHLQNVPSAFLARLATYVRHIGESHGPTVLIGLLGLTILIIWPRITRKVPGGLISLIITTALVQFFDIPVRTIGDQYYHLSLELPSIVMPALSLHTIIPLIGPALTIAFLCVVSSLLTAVASDTILGKKHEPNTELIAQGISNILLGLWGFIPAAGVTTRTVANIENGGRTPISTLIHSILLLLFMIFLLPLLRLIPMVTLASMLFIAAYGISGWRAFVHLLKAPKSDVFIMLVTFVLTIVIDLSVSIVVGLVLACVVRLRHFWTNVDVKDVGNNTLLKKFPGKVQIYEVSGSLFFGDTDKFLSSITLEKGTKVLILRLQNVGLMDATAMRTIGTLHEKCQKNSVRLVLSETLDHPYKTMKKMGVIQLVGKENICKYFDKTIRRVTSYLEKSNLNQEAG